MIKEPKDLYEYLINNYSLSVKEICEMHTSCVTSKSCETKQNVKNLLNFDDVMRDSYTGKGATPPSVDGITYKESGVLSIVSNLSILSESSNSWNSIYNKLISEKNIKDDASKCGIDCYS